MRRGRDGRCPFVGRRGVFRTSRGLERPAIIVNKSTVPVGTAERVARVMGEHTDQPFVVASNPEFLKEGSAVDDFMHPDRVIIGTTDERTRAVLRRLYQPFCRTNDRLIFMDARSAELTKYATDIRDKMDNIMRAAAAGDL